jgi:hypothetical protein
MRIMKTLTMSRKTLAKMTVTAAVAVVLRIVLTTRNPLGRLTSPTEMLETFPLRQFVPNL